MYGSLFIYVVLVAGTKIIILSTDGLSRGDCISGIMTNGEVLSHIPIGLGASKWLVNIKE